MKKLRKIICVLLCLAMAMAFAACSKPDEVIPEKPLSENGQLALASANNIIKWYKTNAGLAETDDVLSGKNVEKADASVDWLAINLAAIGYNANYTAYKTVLEAEITAKSKLEKPFDKMQATDFQRMSLAYLACGGDPNAVGADKIDLFSLATNFDKASFQGVNGLTYGLLTLNMAGKITSEVSNKFISEIMSYQNASGGIAWFGSTSDADLVGMVVSALAPYYADKTEYSYTSKNIKEGDANKTFSKSVKTFVDEMLGSLKTQQAPNGNIAGAFGENPSSTAMVIVGLSAIGSDVFVNPDFIKEGKTLFDGLNLFKMEDNGFRYKYGENGSKKSDGFSTKDALTAFSAYYKFAKNNGSPFVTENLAIMSVDCKKILNNLDKLDPALNNEKYLPKDGVIVLNAFVKINKGDSALDVTKTLGKTRGIKMDISSGYVSGINNIMEKSCGATSGWLYKFNNVTPSVGANNQKVKSGDTVSWVYTVTGIIE